MSNALEIDGKILHPIKEAAQLVSYSRDYVTRLAREEKIIAQLVGRQWFVDVDSLRRYAEMSAIEQELRKKRLSDELKREREAREAVEEATTLRLEQSDGSHSRAVSVAALVLCLGLVAGWGALSLLQLTISDSPSMNVAQVSDSAPQPDFNPTPPAEIDDSTALIPVYSSRSIEDMPIENGVLLLPATTTSESIEMFSDEVIAVEDEEGGMRVQRVDSEGNPVGNKVPFVVVPVQDQRN